MERLSEVHKIIFQKIIEKQWNGTIEMERLRRILRMVFTIPKDRMNRVIRELCELNLISLSGGKWVYINQESLRAFKMAKEVECFA